MLRKQTVSTGVRPLPSVAPAVVQIAFTLWLLRGGMPVSIAIALVALLSSGVCLYLLWRGPLGDTPKLLISVGLLGLPMALVMESDFHGLGFTELRLAEVQDRAAAANVAAANAPADTARDAPASAGYTHVVQLDGGAVVSVTGSRTAARDAGMIVLQLSWYASRGPARRYCGTTSASAKDEAAATAILDRMVEETVSGRIANRNPCNQRANPW